MVWIKDELSRNQLRLLYESSHAFVLPTRGEGWGLPIVEAMAMGECMSEVVFKKCT